MTQAETYARQASDEEKVLRACDYKRGAAAREITRRSRLPQTRAVAARRRLERRGLLKREGVTRNIRYYAFGYTVTTT